MTEGQRLAARARQIAVAHATARVREVGRNRGPEVDRFLTRGGGLDPEGHAYPWCAAFACCCYFDAADELGIAWPFPPCASVGKLWSKANRFFTRVPMQDAIALHLSDPKDTWSPGHVGIVIGFSRDGSVESVEGNTNGDGSRDGDGVYIKTRPLSFWNFGFIDISQPPRVA